MAKTVTAAERDRIAKTIALLVEASESDTVFADVYLHRAGELLAGILSASEYYALKDAERQIEEAVVQTRAATARQDWPRVEALAAQVEGLRRKAEQQGALAALGAKVYDAVGVSLDPFSPGFESLLRHEHDLAELRSALVEKLKALAAADPSRAGFCGSRRDFFANLRLLPRGAAATTVSAVAADSAALQQLAAHAAQAGDMKQLRLCAQELLARQAKSGTPAERSSASQPAVEDVYRCPIDLDVPFRDEVAGRARPLGFAVARAEPLAQAAPLFTYLTAHLSQPRVSGAENEREGAMRIAAVVNEVGFPPDVSEPLKILVSQFVRNAFVNSGGARYLPQFRAEQALIEDFPEGQEPPVTELLTALRLKRRRSLARLEIDDALREHGAAIVAERLGLDPLEFRLVCIPHDLYMRLGRERGWGQQQQWTHFDGYQILKHGALRALVGGDVRHGGLIDLLSISLTDQRESVVARFAVIRRARQVARWR